MKDTHSPGRQANLFLTRRGYALLAAATALAASGWLFGIEELLALALGAICLVAFSCGLVKWRRWSVSCARGGQALRVSAGTSAAVELVFRNTSRGISPVLGASDPFEGGRSWATFALAPLGPGASVRSSYRIPTSIRGVFGVGPVHLEFADPLAIARVRRVAEGRTTVTVYPRMVAMSSFANTAGVGAGNSHGWPVSGSSGVREYRSGDDVRKVHWASTARVGELMVRQEEAQARLIMTVAVDLSYESWVDGGLETALSAAASLVAATLADGVRCRVVASGGMATAVMESPSELGGVLDLLAAAPVLTPGAEPEGLARHADLCRGSAVAIISSDNIGGRAFVSTLSRVASPLWGAVLVVPEPGGAPTPREPGPDASRRGACHISVLEDLPSAWAACIARRSIGERW